MEARVRGDGQAFRWLLGELRHEALARWPLLFERDQSVPAPSRDGYSHRISQALLPFAGEYGAVYLPAFGCASCPGQCGAAGCEHAQYKFYAYVRPENLAPGWSRDRIIEAINAEGVPCYQGSCSEVYLEKAFDDTGWRPQERLPLAKTLGETSIMFLVHPTLTDMEVAKTCEVIKTVMTEASNAS